MCEPNGCDQHIVGANGSPLCGKHRPQLSVSVHAGIVKRQTAQRLKKNANRCRLAATRALRYAPEISSALTTLHKAKSDGKCLKNCRRKLA